MGEASDEVRAAEIAYRLPLGPAQERVRQVIVTARRQSDIAAVVQLVVRAAMLFGSHAAAAVEHHPRQGRVDALQKVRVRQIKVRQNKNRAGRRGLRVGLISDI
jgi:hypothetical protein